MSNKTTFFTNLDALAKLDAFASQGMVSPVEFMVGSALCQYMGHRDVCWPTREEISKRTNIRRVATISAAITTLVRIGFIDRERAQRGTRYHLHRDKSDDFKNSGDASTATPEKFRRSTTRTSDVALGATPANTLQENKKENNICAFSTEGEQSLPAPPSTDAKPVEEPATPPPPPAKKPGKKPTVKTLREQAAERIVDLYRQKVRSAALDVATPKAHSVKRICEIMQGGATEEQLVRSVEKCASHYVNKEPEFRVGIRKFFSKGQGDVWRSFLDMTNPESKAVSTRSLDHLDYWHEKVAEQYGNEWGHRFRAKAEGLGDEKAALAWVKEQAAAEKEMCIA